MFSNASETSRTMRFREPVLASGHVALSLVCLLLFLPFASQAAETLQRIGQRGALTWGADAEGGAPYVFADPIEPTRLTGFEHDLAEALAAKLGLRAQMIQNSWDGLVPALQRANF